MMGKRGLCLILYQRPVKRFYSENLGEPVKVAGDVWDVFSDVNYLSRSPWGSLPESPWTDLTWISSPNRSCSIWRDTPVRTCGGGEQTFTCTLTTKTNDTRPHIWLPDTRVFAWTGFYVMLLLHCKMIFSVPAIFPHVPPATSNSEALSHGLLMCSVQLTEETVDQFFD